jgi:hypothetical protein
MLIFFLFSLIEDTSKIRIETIERVNMMKTDLIPSFWLKVTSKEFTMLKISVQEHITNIKNITAHATCPKSINTFGHIALLCEAVLCNPCHSTRKLMDTEHKENNPSDHDEGNFDMFPTTLK